MARPFAKRKLRADDLSLLIKREAYTLRIQASEEHGGVHTHEYVESAEYRISVAFDNLADRIVGLR
jgi:hypothetical protein